MAIVSIVQDKNIRFAVQKAIDLLGGIESFVHPQDKVVIKPNLVFGLPPFTGFTTDPPIIDAIIQLCQSMNPSETIIAEGSGGIDTKLAFRISGYMELAKKHSVRLVDLNESPAKKVAVPDGEVVRELRVPKVILDCDVLINVPKLKIYRQIPKQRDWVSLAVKNLVGAIPGQGEYSPNRPSGFSVELSREFWTTEGKYFNPSYQQWWSPRGEKKRIHKSLAQGLVDIHMVIKPALNVIDGILVSNDVDMTHTRGESPFELDIILASRDPLAVDCIAARIAGLDPFDISYLKHAAERGVGESDYKRIQLLGTPLEETIRSWELGYASP
ncbi:MAG: DUF362 domain-containing protein [Candidatus Thorarchaeota archaeon]|jgi:uncharacterized protein (DUF362 family)